VGSEEVGNENFKLRIFVLFVLFAGVDIHLYNATIVLPFRQRMFVASLSAGRRPAVMNVFAFQATMSSCIENFLGLKSRIFITAEFILRHESSSETCLEGSTFICHEDAKTRSWLRPLNIITPALPGGSACPLILRGQLMASVIRLPS
jgi:hypothetical protein